eukprot:TRINITY_DN212_c0_g1_i4.p1 TRINITY_DN212_c0_g1~~TRINITY_DN212_c0_g1_i4.p1  ORF type:complete len:133 (+),score=25.26 TRINITY_DN212_c0_g1_i4:513-911(+)
MRTSRAMGMMRLMLRTLALMVVHKQTAASKSTSPWSTGQHVSLALLPIPMCTRPPNKSTHAPSLRVSMGHVSWPVGGGGGHGFSLGGDGGLGTTGGYTTGGVGGLTGGVGTTGGYTTGGVGGLTGGLGTTGG